MAVTDSEAWPVGLARTWVTRYNRFLFLTVAVREFVRKGWAAGCLRDEVTAEAWGLVDAADHLRAHGYAPHLRHAGDEAALWARTVEFVCAQPWRTPPADATFADAAESAAQGRAAWARFTAFVGGLGDECFAAVPALGSRATRPDGLAALVGKGAYPPAPPQGQGQAGDEDLDPVVAVTRV